MNIKCPQCGFENEEGSKFCKNCNLPLSKQDYDEDNPYSKKNIKEEKMKAEIRAFQAEKAKIEGEEDKRLNNVYKCPKCNASIEEGVKLCGNCKAQIVWKNGKPRLSTAYVMQKTGCALTSLGCLIPLLIGLAIVAYVVIASFFGD
jgi:uncharacterized membrane protein YvbJ